MSKVCIQRELRASHLRNLVCNGFEDAEEMVPPGLKMWYRQKGRALTTGRRELVNDEDVRKLLETVDKLGILDLYYTSGPQQTQTQTTQVSPSTCTFRSKIPGFSEIIRDYHVTKRVEVGGPLIKTGSTSQDLDMLGGPITQNSQTNPV